jgi:hypothetical protein
MISAPINSAIHLIETGEGNFMMRDYANKCTIVPSSLTKNNFTDHVSFVYVIHILKKNVNKISVKNFSDSKNYF